MPQAGVSSAIPRALSRQAMSAPLLEEDEEHALAERWRNQGDKSALDALTIPHLRLAISNAVKFGRYGPDAGDLVQEGVAGLMEAARRFDPERGVRFATYANWWIRAAIQDYLLRNWSLVRIGTKSSHKRLFFNYNRIRALIEATDGVSAAERNQRIAETLGVSREDVEFVAARPQRGDASLNAKVANDTESERQDFVPDERPNPEENATIVLDAGKQSLWLQAALEKLTEREYQIVSERFFNEERVTLASLGLRLGISKERVRQIERQALSKLRSHIKSGVGDPFETGLL